jgi:hypothetical protein
VKFFLSTDLFGHRRGRFLASILNASEWPENMPPESGFVLVGGEAFQQSAEKQASYLSWARLPGRCLLLLPPFQLGTLIDGLDWSISFASASKTAPETDSLTHVVAQEVQYQLDGCDGDSESSADHCWDDHASHTRYRKAHSNSGLIAVTVLPLWSISLMDHADLLESFLTWFAGQAGKASTTLVVDEEKSALEPKDYTVMVCCYGMNVSSATELSEAINKNAVPLLDLSRFDLMASFERLRVLGYLDNQGLTHEGLAYLQPTPYWAFAEHLKGVNYS